jgi:glutaredoxin
MAGKAYKWVDEAGNITYQDQPPPADARNIEEKKVVYGHKPVVDEEKQIEAAAEQSPVTLYLVPDCQSCDAARSYLEQRKVPFAEKNVHNNPELQQEMKKKVGALAVPTIVVGERIMKGYIRSLLADELDQAGYPKPAPAPEVPPETAAGEGSPPAAEGSQP